MKNLTLVLLLCLPFFAFTQSNTSIDLIAGVDYSFRTLQASDEYQFILDSRQQEAGKLNTRFGFNFNKKVADRWYLKTGLRLAGVGYTLRKLTNLRWPNEQDGNGMYVPDPNLPHEIRFTEDYWFLELPVMARFELGQKRWTPFVEAGVLPSVYLKTRIGQYTDVGNSATFVREDIPGFNNFQMAGSVSFGMNYNLNQQIQFFGQPVFRYYFTKLTDKPVKEHLYSAGMELGCRFILK